MHAPGFSISVKLFGLATSIVHGGGARHREPGFLRRPTIDDIIDNQLKLVTRERRRSVDSGREVRARRRFGRERPSRLPLVTKRLRRGSSRCSSTRLKDDETSSDKRLLWARRHRSRPSGRRVDGKTAPATSRSSPNGLRRQDRRDPRARARPRRTGLQQVRVPLQQGHDRPGS